MLLCQTADNDNRWEEDCMTVKQHNEQLMAAAASIAAQGHIGKSEI